MEMENESWKSKNGKWKLEIGKWKLENGNWKSKNGNWKIEVGKWKLEVGKWKSETRSGMAPIGHPLNRVHLPDKMAEKVTPDVTSKLISVNCITQCVKSKCLLSSILLTC